jgi:general secretion pathway protein A
MYLEFYGLAEKPFNMTPDPRFLFLTEGHREALAQLLYAVRERRGFMVLTGEAGTGKTTLLQTLLRRLDGDTAVAYVNNTALTFDEIVEYALADLGVEVAGSSRARRLLALNRFLIERVRAGQNTVLVIDEAHNLDAGTLEQVRLLSNFESPTDKLLQILLVGQPELRARLARPDLRQLKQRIALRCHLPALSAGQTRDYIRTRLSVAGAPDRRLFSDVAVERIAAASGGIPRLVNAICDHCLLIGYSEQTRQIDERITRRAVAYLDDDATPERESTAPSRRPRLAWAAGAAVATGVALAVALASGVSDIDTVVTSAAAHVHALADSALLLLRK